MQPRQEQISLKQPIDIKTKQGLDDLYDNLYFGEMPKFLLLWALRACIVSGNQSGFHCHGLLKTIHDWFGRDSDELIQNAQIIAWANYNGAPLDLRFKPTASEVFRREEKILFETIEAINDNNSPRATELCQSLTGGFSDIAYNSFLSLASIMRKIN